MSYSQTLSKLSTSKITEVYNQFAPLVVNKFRDKETALVRTSKVLSEVGVTVEQLEAWAANNKSAEELRPDIKPQSGKNKMQNESTEQKQEPTSEDKPKKEKNKKESNIKKTIVVKECSYKYQKDSQRGKVLAKLKDGMTVKEFLSPAVGGTSLILKVFQINGNVELKDS